MKIINMRLWLLLAAFFSLALLNSCEEDVSTAPTSEVQLLSFGPSGLRHGEKVKFIGYNLDKVTGIVLGGAPIPQSAFVSQSKDSIWVTIPQEAVRGKAVLTTPDGVVESLSMIDFEVPVTVTSVPLTAKPGDVISIKGNFVNWITGVRFEKDTTVSVFESTALNEIKVKVPLTAQTGKLLFYTAGTEPLEILSDTTLELTLPAITSFTPNPVERENNITIRGTNLDLVKAVLFKGASPYYLDSAISKSATEIVLKVPKSANRGTIGLQAYSDLIVESAEVLNIAGDMPPPEALKVVFYDDELRNGWLKWGGWGSKSSATDLAATQYVREGLKSIKVEFGGDWGGPLQFGSGNSPTAGTTHLVAYVYGGPGTNGKKMRITAKGGSPEFIPITLVEGEWTEYKIPLSSYGSPANITEFFLQDEGFSGTIWIDYIGLR